MQNQKFFKPNKFTCAYAFIYGTQTMAEYGDQISYVLYINFVCLQQLPYLLWEQDSLLCSSELPLFLT